MSELQPTPDNCVSEAVKMLRSEIGACKQTASLLLALAGGGLAALAATAPAVPWPVLIPAGIGAAAMLAAIWHLLTAVYPSLGGPGWPAWPQMDDDDLSAHLAHSGGLPQVRMLASTARARFEHVQRSVVLLRIAVLSAAGAGLLALVLALV
ncbi:hypothetical protein [Streptomyces axinellae]|uniref:Pycsar effector protein domain-containing protein n=1 Tax=Streptomyces axinellae TaxID=552788 RepID=A0ABN3R106_9ACTN